MELPTSTYRLQFDPAQLTLDQARRLVPYLDALGVSHLFASPLLRSRPGSVHGYDVVDPSAIDPELGGMSSFERLSAALGDRSMGLILDIVPNHMAIGHHNPWWMEVLAEGPAAPHGRHFDLFWEEDQLPLPFLGRPYAEAVEAGEIRLVHEDGVVVAYWDARFPLSSESLDKSGIDPTDPRIDETIERLNADPDALHRLLDLQHYRLVWWQLSRERLAHRRFFTIAELVGVRQEDEGVFRDTHGLVADLVSDRLVQGLRIDHVDGLWDPQTYLDRLRDATAEDTYVVVEKILAPGEELPAAWATAGTTGYEYLDVSGKLFVDRSGHDLLAGHYRSFTGGSLDFDAIVHDQQRFIMHERLGPETARFAAELEELARRDRIARDVLPSELIEAAIDVLAALPVYRTYIRDGEVSESDRAHVDHAIEAARELAPDRDPRTYDFLREVLALAHEPDLEPHEAAAREAFVRRVQQFTGAVMAKGVEDTAFYQFNLLVSLNEVGGHPMPMPDDPVGDFHHHNRTVAGSRPHTMTTTSTHDTKRSEDVRARITALTQVAGAWTEKVEAWHVANRRHRTSASAPTRNEELLVYQTLIGAWPMAPSSDFEDRLRQYLVKAAREAKVHTAWLEPDEEHERALTDFAGRLLHDDGFVADLQSFARPVWKAGALDSLAQLALRLLAPGVPDIYQGQELWDLSLTDPDNRRPIDWDLRRRLLGEVDHARRRPGFLAGLAGSWEDGRLKLLVTTAGLRLRTSDPDLFTGGDYLPLDVHGDRAEHVVAFARHHDRRWALAVAPRLTLSISGEGLWPREGWETTSIALPEGAPTSWSAAVGPDIDSVDGALPVAAVFGEAPVGIFTSDLDHERNP